MIKHISMKHGWYYFYRVHQAKSESLLNGDFQELHDYLGKMFDECPHDYFTCGPRSSHLTFDVKKEHQEVKFHETSQLALDALQNMERYKTAHSKVEVFMLEKDDKTIAVEVPIWLMPHELDQFSELFDSEDPLTGHIDILRIEEGKIWIWDFKPKADKEKHAHVQTLFYAIMLSKRTGIGLENFMCGYFDENTSYVFKPELDMVKFI